MANPPKPEPVQGGFLKSLTGGQNHQQLLAQQVVTWQDDETVTQCPFCESLLISTFPNRRLPFNFSNRKHHCRLCGRVVCSNPLTNCSTNIGLNVSGGMFPRWTSLIPAQSEKRQTSEISVDVRMCRECKSIVFGKRDFARESTKTPKYVAIYQVSSLFPSNTNPRTCPNSVKE